jgi:type I restriction enzyme S subunit
MSKPQYGLNAPATEFDPRLPRYLRITDVDDDGRLREGDVVSVEVENPAPYLLSAGDLLFARTGNTVGKAYLADGTEGNTVFAGYLIRFSIDTDKVDPNYVFACTRSTSYSRWIQAKSRIGAQPNINAAEYAELPIWLPPHRAMQAVLVSRISLIRGSAERSERHRRELCELRRRLMARYCGVVA